MNLLTEGIEKGYVIKTKRSKKLTIDGLSDDYDIYKVRLDLLFYNDQNDRIATWLSEYESKNSTKLNVLDREKYNSIIHDFITKSNEEKLKATELNIELNTQEESGVVLADGRIIDGNRRFTCLRNLSKKSDKFNYFETTILNKNYERDEKQIKMLELQIQIGKEERVDYDPIDKLVGLYRDVEVKKLLTIDEYARGTNMKVSKAKSELEVANLMVEFLEYINAKDQFYLARELNLNGPLRELQRILNKNIDEDKCEQIKCAVFSTMLVCPEKDLTRFVRKYDSISTSKYADDFIDEQIEIAEKVIDNLPTNGKVNNDVISEIRKDDKLRDSLSRSVEKYDNKVKVVETKNKPLQFVKRASDMIGLIDQEVIKHMNENQKEEMIENINDIEETIKEIKEALNV